MNNNHKYLYCIQYRTGDEQTHIVHTWFETHPDDGVVKGIIKKDLKPAKFINDFSYYMVYDKSQEVPFVDEVEESRMKKVEKMKRAIQLLNNVRSDEYIRRAEEELGKLKNTDWFWNDREDTEEEKNHNSKVFKRGREIEESEWKELWLIIKGQDIDEFSSKYQKIKDSEPQDEMHSYTDWFDGSGLRGWWD